MIRWPLPPMGLIIINIDEACHKSLYVNCGDLIIGAKDQQICGFSNFFGVVAMPM